MTLSRPDPPPEPGLLGRVTSRVTKGVADTVDVNILLDHVDVNALLDRIDPDRLLDRVDPDRLLDRVDPDRLLDRIDPDRLLDRVDLQRLLARVDVDSLLAGVDLNRVLARVDLETLVRRSGVPDIVAESTGRMAGSALDVARRQVVGLDYLLERIVDRVLLRSRSQRPTTPPLLRSAAADAPPDPLDQRSVTGHYAGLVSRGLAAAADVGVVMGSYTVAYAGVDLLARAFLGVSLEGERSGPVAAAMLAGWAFLYSFVSLAVAGRTLGKTLLGLRVLRADGSPLTVRTALVRTLAFPLNALLLGIPVLLIPLQREHRGIHDLIAGTAEVYDWGGRSATLPGPLSDFLARHQGTPGPAVTPDGP